eukprot:2898465-Rhodomonas_salina.1
MGRAVKVAKDMVVLVLVVVMVEWVDESTLLRIVIVPQTRRNQMECFCILLGIPILPFRSTVSPPPAYPVQPATVLKQFYY